MVYFWIQENNIFHILTSVSFKPKMEYYMGVHCTEAYIRFYCIWKPFVVTKSTLKEKKVKW